MANGDQQIRDAVAPLENRLAELHQKVDKSETWQVETAKILSRLSTITIGDPAIGHVGLLQKSQEHAAYIAEQKTKQAEARGGKKMLVVVSGAGGVLLAKGFDLALTLLSRGH